ncbi:unnamed protein product [Laminaria digitata]
MRWRRGGVIGTSLSERLLENGCPRHYCSFSGYQYMLCRSKMSGDRHLHPLTHGKICFNFALTDTILLLVGGRGEKSLLCDPGSELRLWRERDRSAKIINEMEKIK